MPYSTYTMPHREHYEYQCQYISHPSKAGTIENLSNEISDVHGHFIDLGTVVLFNIPQHSDIITLDEVDGHTLPSVPPGPPYSMDVQLSVVGEVVVDDQGHLRDVKTT